MKVTAAQRRKIRSVIAGFDFARVATAMRLFNWKWARKEAKVGEILMFPKSSKNMYIPEENDLRSCAIYLLEQACLLQTTLSSGGFEASFDGTDLNLKFVLVEIDR